MEVFVEKIDELITDYEYDMQSKSFYSSISCFKYIKKIKNIYKFTINNIEIYASIDKKCELYVAMRSIDSSILDNLLEYIFKNFNVDCIFIDHLYTKYESKNFNPVLTGVNSDVLMRLPNTIDEYNNLLGKKTKKHLRYYISRLNKEFVIESKIYIKNEITLDLINKMVKFNDERLTNKKGINKNTDFEYINCLYNTARECGILSVLFLNGNPEAFSLVHDVGKDYFLTDIGSNIEFDFYNVGQVSLYKIIEFCIDNKNDESNFHFMFEITDYKKRFGGKMVELYPYVVYKNKFFNILNIFKYKISVFILRLIKRNENVSSIIKKIRKIIRRG